MVCISDFENPSDARFSRSWRHPVDLSYTEVGEPTARPLVLLVGLGMQMHEWPRTFLENLSKSFRVICVENRDAGQSLRCGPDSEPNIASIWLHADEESATKYAPYSVFDMRDDVIDLLDKLNIQSFDIIGFSMGGMIAQLVAAKTASRVGSFIQFASNDGTIHMNSTDEAKRRIARLFVEPEASEQIKEYLLEDTLYYGAGRVGLSDELIAEIEKIYLQGFSCGGSARQALAVLSSGDRRDQLRTIRARTLVVHGDSDPCISPQSGKTAAELIPNAKFKLLKGVGHIVDEQMCAAALSWLCRNQSSEFAKPTN
ncbi:alpha/beta fold hydrolase [Roseovarius sp. EL26]|uniref:alpha/beta fold hydrolase n=1 Tax=Roseovarius sp. EL26 TaxID=2126672 RepID=UPI000EA214E2|nr:alpha/beta hydrolase [Roseovarius sp. EL26]